MNRTLSALKMREVVKQRLTTCTHCGLQFYCTSPHQKWCILCAPDRRSRGYLRRFNLSAPELNILVRKSNGMCHMCFAKPWTDLDHDHKTNKVRGLLCSGCNTGLGIIEKTDFIKQAKLYLEVYSHSIC